MFKAIPNHTTSELFDVVPWQFVPNVPEHARASKAAFGEWAKSEDTHHCFFTLMEAECPTLRPNKNNPVRKMHGLVCDYDISGQRRITPEEIERIKEALPESVWPNWVSSTFSGGARLIWLFESPVLLDLPHLREMFVVKLAEGYLKADKLLPGLDKKALKDVNKTYDVGCDWRQFRSEPLTKGQVEDQLFRAAQACDYRKFEQKGIVIPLAAVREEIENRWPGRWEGPFEAGCRGVVFFDDTSKNRSASIVTDTGMVCFGQAQTFYDWERIFGKAFVDKFEQDKIGNVVKDVWVDTKGVYWYHNGEGVYWPHNKEALQLFLKAGGLDDSRRKEPMSEIDKAVHYINQHKTVDKVMPCLFVESAIVVTPTGRMLNTSRAKVFRPAEQDGVWGPEGNFPFMSDLLDSCFDDEDVRQLDHFLGWWKWAYEGALEGKARRGHALFFIGPVDTGKSFLTNVPLALSFGGAFPAAEYLKGENKYPKEEFEKFLWTVDDTSASHSEDTARKFGEQIKSHVVNTKFSYNPKFVQAGQVEWNGRIVVTLNEDPQSMKIMPSLDNSIDDKVMCFKMRRPKVKFSKDYEANKSRIMGELPYFLRWLLEWEIPANVQTGEGDRGARLGVKGYIHEDVRKLSLQSGGHTVLLEMIHKFMRGIQADKGENLVGIDAGGLKIVDDGAALVWTGSALDITTAMQADTGLGKEAARMNARQVGRNLGLLCNRGVGVEKAKEHNSKSDTAIWRICMEK